MMALRAEGEPRWRLGPFLLAPPALVLLLFVLLPLVFLVRVSLCAGGGGSGFGLGGQALYQGGTWTTVAYDELFHERYFSQVMAFTGLLGVGLVGLTLLFAYPLALFLHGLAGWRKALGIAAVLIPKLANLLVVLYGCQLLLGNSGSVNRGLVALGIVTRPIPLTHNLAGVLIGETYLLVPYATLILFLALERTDSNLRLAARGLGAGPLTTFWRVTLPLSARGLFVAATVCFTWGMGAFLAPTLLGSPNELTLAALVHREAMENLHWPRAAAVAVLMIVALSVVLLAFWGAIWGAARLLARVRAAAPGAER